MYTGMRKTPILITGIVLALPSTAWSKGGVIWDKYPDTAGLGEKIRFTVMTFHEAPTRGRRPLVTFRSDAGRVVRVRASRTDPNGIAYGDVAFPERGPWTTEVKVGRRLLVGAEASIPIRVGVGLTQTIPSADHAAAARSRPASPDGASAGRAAWVLVVAALLAASALTAATIRRRRRWGRA